MTVRKRGSGFQADFMLNGIRYRETFETENEAVAWEHAARAALLTGRPVPQKLKKAGGKDAGTMAEVLRSAKMYHWDRLKGSQKTVMVAAAFVRWVGENLTPAEALTQEQVDGYVRHLIDQRRANGTINRHLAAISILAKYARVTGLSLEYRKEGDPRIRFFTPEEEKLILQTLRQWGKDRLADFFVFLVDTGARTFSETHPIRWTDLNSSLVTLWHTKAGTPRTLKLTPRARDAVERQKGHPEAVAGPWQGITPRQIKDVWAALRAHFPWLHDAVPYTFRHTCCSRLVQAGVGLVHVKEWMGHSNIATTMRYAHLAPKHLLSLADVLESAA